VERQPITRNAFLALLADELKTLESDTRDVYSRYRVEPEVIYRVFPGSPSDPVPTYVIARSAASVIFYDDIEEEWGTADVAHDGHVYDWGTWGESLAWALRNFPIPRSTAGLE
jgi:hypothetical protein